jgi:hypothetical protein
METVNCSRATVAKVSKSLKEWLNLTGEESRPALWGFLIDFIADMLRNCLLNATFSGSPSKQVFICSSNLPDLHRYVPVINEGRK